MASFMALPSESNLILEIIEPDDLVRNTNGGRSGELSPAMFGLPMFGESLTGLVIVPADSFDGCNRINSSLTPSWPPRGTVPVVVILKRQICNFVVKVKHAQDAGAHAVIVVDNTHITGRMPFMADDGTGAAITIPSLFLNQLVGDQIIASVNAGKRVSVKITWSLPNPDNRVEYELWTSANDPISKPLKAMFKETFLALGDRALFTPHYFLYDIDYTYCQNTCFNLCVENKYCAADPERDTSRGVDGTDVVLENLREMIISDYLNETNRMDKWWDYVRIFDATCATNPSAWRDNSCSGNILTQLGLDPNLINTRVTASWYTNGDGLRRNYRLDAELKLKEDEGIFFLPTFLVNLEPTHSLTCPTPVDSQRCSPLTMICAGYLDDTQPDICNWEVCPPPKIRDVCGVCLTQDRIHLANQSCIGCDGVFHSGLVTDACGKCGGDGAFDSCGLCLGRSNPQFNKTCLGCDGGFNSGKVHDCRGICGGTHETDACGACLNPTDDNFISDSKKCNKGEPSGVSVTLIVVIAVVIVVVVGVSVFFYMRRQQRKMQEDVNTLLSQYIPLESSHGVSNKKPVKSKPEDTANLLTSPAPVPSAAEEQL